MQPTPSPHSVTQLRIRYILGLSLIALLITASFFTMRHVIAEQRNFSRLVNLAGHQAGLASRIAYFSNIMASTDDPDEFSVAKGQVGMTIYAMANAHSLLRTGSEEEEIPHITNERLEAIYTDPAMGLDNAISQFLEHAQLVYDAESTDLTTGNVSIMFLATYGPHVLEPLFDAAVEEYQEVGRKAIVKIERLEFAIWVAALFVLLCELIWIFRPLEKTIRETIDDLQGSIFTLKAVRRRLLAAQKLAAVGDWQLALATGEVQLSEQAYAICGLPGEQYGISLDRMKSIIHPDDRHYFTRKIEQVTHHQKPASFQYRICRPDGEIRLLHQQTSSSLDEAGNVTQVTGTIQDITERSELAVHLEKQAENIPGFIFQFRLDPDGKPSFPYASNGCAHFIEVTAKDIQKLPHSFFELIHRNDFSRVRNRVIASGNRLRIWRDQFRMCTNDGKEIWVEGHATPERLPNGGTLWYGYIWNITDRKQSEDKILELAYYDPLTGLANRRLLLERLKRSIQLTRDEKSCGGLLLLDMDNFKTLNDTKGHDIGDAMLIEVANRLTHQVRETDTIARLGGDEFVVVLEQLSDNYQDALELTSSIAATIKDSLSKPYILGQHGEEFNTSVSIGVALFQCGEVSEGELLKQADVAMYEAKELGRNRICAFRQERQVKINSQSEIAGKLLNAINNQELTLHYQPQINRENTPCGVEALLRWTPKKGAPISPATFIPIAEETGLILPLGEWVLETVCRHLNRILLQPIPDDFAVAVNISARQLSDRGFLPMVKTIIERHEVSTRRLKFELTETCLIQDMERGRTILKAIREMGIGLELDDFGTGYSSLNSLKRLPIDTLKLDRTLVKEIEGDSRDQAILRAAIAMAKALSLNVVAEGVETREQNTFLISQGCDIIQGYYHAQPMPLDDLIPYLRRCAKSRRSQSSSSFLGEPSSANGQDLYHHSLATANQPGI